jgi:hypothetical protein
MPIPDALKSQGEISGKIARVALDGAGRCADITTKLINWALAMIGELARV